jgi:Methyltransferase domain
MKRTDIINTLIEKYGYKSYLEVGTQFPSSNFDKINAEYKVSIDPFPMGEVTFVGTSDEYFESITDDVKYDIIFIDGLHHSDQVLKDIENSLNHLSKNGSIVCHDCLPMSEQMQQRDNNGGEWTGDVWKAIAELRVERIDLDIAVVDTDYGCGIIRRGTNVPYETDQDYLTYSYYSMNKWKMLNVISPEQFLEWANSQ